MFSHLSASYLPEWSADVCQRTVSGYRSAGQSGNYLFVKTDYILCSGYVDPSMAATGNLNLFRKEADTSLGWNLILVNDDYCVPSDYEVDLTELSNGEKVDSRIYPQLQQMFDDARAAGLVLFVREGYRTAKDQEDIMDERIQQYQEEGYSRSEAKKLAEEYVAEPGTSEFE